MQFLRRKSYGFTVVELLVAILVSLIVLGAVVSLYISSSRGFQKTKPISDVLEEARSALATLDFLFSRWGMGVPCLNNTCTYNVSITPCDGYPPSDPMCMNVTDNSVEFYANLYGFGFVVSTDGTNAQVISCRLNTSATQNCYYVWNGNALVSGYSGDIPIVYSLQGNVSNVDCINFDGNPNATVSVNMVSVDGSSTYTLSDGNIISRVPHRVRIYVQDGWLLVDKEDMAAACGANENAVRLAPVENFSVTTNGQTVILDITFKSQTRPVQTFRVIKVFGR